MTDPKFPSLPLDDARGSELRHGYGLAGDIPELRRQLVDVPATWSRA